MDKANFIKISYRGGIYIYFDRNLRIKLRTKNKRKTRIFRYHKNLTEFLKSNPHISLYFVEDKTIAPFKRRGNELLVDFNSYTDFCKNIEDRTEGRAKAFFGQHLSIEELLSFEEREEFVKANLSEKILLEAIRKLTVDSQDKI
jgi:hypothetical protein